MTRILLIEDNANAAAGLRANLECEGYEVMLAEDGASALGMATAAPPSLVLLDIALPQLGGLDILRRLRSLHSNVPIIVISAKSENIAVASLRLGADDYVATPFSLLELLERIRLRLQRVQSTSSAERVAQVFNLGDVAVDLGARIIVRNGRQIPLRRKEHELLAALWSAAGAVVGKERLLASIWGFHGRVHTRTIDFHIAKLRAKLEEDPARPRYIMTVRRVGYRLLSS